jgi:CsoR family transcriptional regulator, copper-sensing transcriptional repressor
MTTMTTTTTGDHPTGDGAIYASGMDDYHRKVTNRLKTARGHLDGIIRMVESDAWCPDIMKQLAAVQGMLEGTSREVFRHHLEGHVADAIRAGRGDDIVNELMETLKYDKRVLRPLPTDVDDAPGTSTPV